MNSTHVQRTLASVLRENRTLEKELEGAKVRLVQMLSIMSEARLGLQAVLIENRQLIEKNAALSAELAECRGEHGE